MELEEMLEQTNDAENVETQTTEENVDGIDLTDTTDADESVSDEPEIEEVKTLKELLESNPSYQTEFNNMIKNRLDRQERTHKKELSKYKNVENLLNAGLKTKSIEEAESTLRDYYKEQGVDLPEPIKPGLSDRELQILGQAEADEILELGLDEAEKEANRLANKGHKNWNAKEQATFQKLATTLNYEKQKKELKTIGVDIKILESEDFKNFAKQFNSSTDIKNIYNLYSKAEPKKTFTKLGSMKNTIPDKVEKKYSSDEIDSLSLEDLDNDEIWNAVRKSMTGQI